MTTSTVFTNNRSQAVRLPADHASAPRREAGGYPRARGGEDHRADRPYLGLLLHRRPAGCGRLHGNPRQPGTAGTRVALMVRYLLDANIVKYVIKRRPLLALALFNENAGHMAISSITLATLMHGAEKSNAPTRSLAAVEDFCSRLEVLPLRHPGRDALWKHPCPARIPGPDNRRQRPAHCSSRTQRGPGAGVEQPVRVRARGSAATGELGDLSVLPGGSCQRQVLNLLTARHPRTSHPAPARPRRFPAGRRRPRPPDVAPIAPRCSCGRGRRACGPAR